MAASPKVGRLFGLAAPLRFAISTAMHPLTASVVALLLLVASGLLPVAAAAKMSSWTDVGGASFRGEPAEVLGPFALFRTPGNGGRRVLLRALSEADCRRFFEQVATRPARAASLAEAKGYATRDLAGNVLRVRNRELVPADLTGVPEPALILALYGSHNDGEGWSMVNNIEPFHRRVQRVFPELVQTVFLGARHNGAEHRAIALGSGMPWLVTDFPQQRSLSPLSDYLPPEGARMVLFSREGVPLVAARAADPAAIRGFVDQVSEILTVIDPGNSAAWADRLHYLKAVRPAEFAQTRGEPLLVGDPLQPDVLRRYGVKRVAARLAVDADGKVTPSLLSGPEDVPAELAAPLQAALQQCVVAPAVDRGRPAAGTLDYELEIPPADPARAVDRVWLTSTRFPVVPLERWLVLRPISVPEKEFLSSVEGETESGTVMLSAMEVNSGKVSRAAQMSAFNQDWFAETGADAVRPRAGERQKIDAKTELTWEPLTSRGGYVEMQTGILRDYTVGYAWTEFELPAATDGWLGLGSDDGVKIWLNGQMVHNQWIRRPSRVDDEVVPLRLKQGTNRLLIKIQNATGEWSFIHRLRLKPSESR